MKQKGLMLPHKCQTMGWIIVAVPFVLLGILLLGHLFFSESINSFCARNSWILIVSLYTCIPIGGAILCFSREKEEDEMIKCIRLKAIGMISIAELLICMFFFIIFGLNSVFRFCPDFYSTDNIPLMYYGHYIFCLQFPIYFLLFKFLLYINRKRNEE